MTLFLKLQAALRGARIRRRCWPIIAMVRMYAELADWPVDEKRATELLDLLVYRKDVDAKADTEMSDAQQTFDSDDFKRANGDINGGVTALSRDQVDARIKKLEPNMPKFLSVGGRFRAVMGKKKFDIYMSWSCQLN
jgi:hypothetical protein